MNLAPSGMPARVATIDLQWRALPSVPALDDGVVHLVSARVPAPGQDPRRDWTLLSAPEADRARRFRFDERRNQWVAARALLKRLLALYADCEPGAVRLGFGEIGKPFLREPGAGISFNYTDSGGRVIYAFSRGIELGVDLEVLPRRTNYEGIASRKLTPAERDVFESLPEDARELAILASWTRKEAYGKALGVGIRYPMNEVTLCEDYAEPRHLVTGRSGATHCLVQLRPPFSAIACVAAEASRFDLEAYTFSA